MYAGKATVDVTTEVSKRYNSLAFNVFEAHLGVGSSTTPFTIIVSSTHIEIFG